MKSLQIFEAAASEAAALEEAALPVGGEPWKPRL